MWGCLRTLFVLFVIGFALLFIFIGGGWFYLGTTSFSGLVRLRIEKTLEARLGRDVTIGKVTIVRSRPQKVIIDDLRIANAPGGVNRYFATVRQVEIFGGIESFWSRRIKVGRIDIRDPRMFFEIANDGSHNFPKWKTGPRRKYEIYHLDLGKMYITGGGFSFLDRKHDIAAVAQNIGSEITVTRAEDLYAGVMNSPLVRVRIQDYVPFDLDMRGGFRYTPGVLALQSIALRGRGIEAFVSGKLDPLTEGVYDLRVTSQVGLERIKEIFKVSQILQGTLALDTRLSGKQGNFTLAGGWASARVVADVYELTQAKGKLNVTGERAVIDVDSARYGGGNIGAHYELAKYAEPYPMSVELRYDGISIEKLFGDWGVQNTGLRAAATGRLEYQWNKDKVLEGSGTGSARLAKNATAFSSARYPIPIAGATDFALDRGTITFRNAELDTDASHVSVRGSLRIEDLNTNLEMAIRSSDFAELDRIGYNFAHSADKRDYELLGLGGAGTITGTVKGPLKTPQVVAQINATGVRYNEVLLGGADIALRYDGVQSVLTFDRAVFTDAGGRLALTGTISFPDRGPGPKFDIAVDATNYPAQRAIDAVKLDFKIGAGIASGRLLVAGTPESGRVTFAGLTVRRAEAELRLRGDIEWLPGDGNVRFDLDIAARDFPVADLIAFLDLGALPVTGDLTGTLNIRGPKDALEGSGSVTVRRGSIYGEPVDLASADITFTTGSMKATNVVVRAPAGEIRGEAEYNFATERFNYNITSSEIDLSKLKLLESLKDLFGGRIILTSTGAGTLEQPELVVQATLADAVVRGLALPEGTPAPSIYVAIRNGRLIVKGAVGDLVTIDGEGAVGAELAVDGLVRIVVRDVAKALALWPAAATIPATGNLTVELRLGGKLSPIEALRIDGSVPDFNLAVSGHPFTAPEPLRFALRDGRFLFEQFTLQHTDGTFTVGGSAEIVGAKRLDLSLRGHIEAALFQLFMPGLRADGHVIVTAGINGTLAEPRVTGSAELQQAQVRFPGFPQLISDITGTLVFRGDRIDIDSIRATVGGGTVVAGGSVALDGLKPRSARVSLQGTNVAIRYFEGLTVEGNFNMLVSGDAERAVVQGDVAVTRALYFKDFNFQQALLNVIVARRGISPVAAASWQDRVELRLRVVAPTDTLAVRNNIADVTASAELDVTGTLANPVILGEVTLTEGGTVRFQGVDYNVVRGTIAFQNPFRIDPFFDVTVEGRVSGGVSEIESGPLDVTINLTGTIDRFTPTITSDPPASDITLFSILGFGGLTGRGNTASTATAGTVGQSLLLSNVISALGQRILPFADSFTYDPGLLETGQGAGPKVTFERRLSNNLRLLVVYNLKDHKSREVLEWTVNRDWTLQLTRDQTESEYRVDARFRRRYAARWTWGDRGRDPFATMASISEGASVAPMPTTPPPPTTAVAPRAAAGATIEQINFRADARFDTTTLDRYVTLRPGAQVSVREVQSSVKNLFATGNFRDIRVDATPGATGTVLTFSLFLHYRVGRIEFDGLGGSDRTRAERELTVRVGEVLSLNDVDDSAEAVTAELTRNGYLEATVDPETTFDRERSVANVVFHVAPGPRARIANVVIEGNTAPFGTAQLIKEMRREPGANFSVADARNDAERMQTYMVRREHRRADVDYLGHTYDGTTKTVTLRYRAEAGPIVRVEVVGVPRNAVRRQLPFRRRNQEYSEDVIDRAATDMVRSYQQRGYFNAAVDTESRLENGTWTTTFNVQPGERYRLADVTFSGNVKLQDKELDAIVETTPRGGIRRIVSTLFRRPTGVTAEQLSDDRDALESYYRLQGFSEATVGTPVAATRNGTLVVDFPIVEGPQTIVTDITIEGIEKIKPEDLPRLALRPGQPLNPQLEREDIVRVQSYYAERGYAEVQVAPRIDVSADKTAAKITYTVTEGPRIEVDEVIVRGNTYTSSEVILRTSDVEQGDPFSYTSILESQRNLYRLGIFQRVDVQPEQAGTSVGDRDVVITVEEGRNLTLSGAVGIRASESTSDAIDEGEEEEDEGDGRGFDISPRVAVAAAHRNLFGTGRYLGLEAVWSRDEKEAFITYREPFIGRWNVPVQVSIYQTDDSTRPGTRIQQRGVSVEATKVARYRTRWSLRYEYKISECKEDVICSIVSRDLPVAGLDRSLADIQISSITPTFFWDTRDDILNPTRGFFTSASVEYAFPLFSSETNFLKEFVQGAWYLPLTERTVFALSGRVGLIQAFRDRDDDGNLVEDRLDLVPLSERFTAGGESSHRGFPLDLLGSLCIDERDFYGDPPRCKATLFREIDRRTGLPVGPLLPLGGGAMFLMNAEYRFPIFSSVGGAVFADVGNVYGESTIRLNDLRYGAGFGIRYLSPVGPLRIDIGFPFQRRIIGFANDEARTPEYERAFSYFITLGYAF